MPAGRQTGLNLPVGRTAVIEKYNHPASSFAYNSVIHRLPLPQASIAPGFSPGIRENITHYIIPLHAQPCQWQ
ncbi:MAG: hypothetical protein JXA72_07180, partial [Bacteroidales bacterium]|nr:hypothetical protein [Bacteroidales bacterium]